VRWMPGPREASQARTQVAAMLKSTDGPLAVGGAGLAWLARGGVGGGLCGTFGRTLGLLLRGNFALRQLLTLLDDLLGLLDASRERDGGEHGLLRIVEVGDALDRSEVGEA